MSLFKFRKNRKAVNPELWDDTPSSFPVMDVYQQSIIKRRSVWFQQFKITALLLLISIDSISHHHEHKAQDIFFCIILIIIGNFIPGCVRAKKNKELITYSFIPAERLNCLVIKYDVNSFPTLMALLGLCIEGKGRSSLENPIIYHLREILPKLRKEHLESLGQSERKILLGLITAKPELWPDIPVDQISRMERIGAALTTSLIEVLGRSDDEQSIHALKLRYRSTKSSVIRDLIKKSIQGSKPNDGLLFVNEMELTTSESDFMLKKVSVSKEESRSNTMYRIGRAIPRILLLEVPFVLILYYLIISSHYLNILEIIIYILILIVIRLISLKIPIVTGASIIVTDTKAATDEPDALLDLLSTFRRKSLHSISHLLILMEIFKNISFENSVALNPLQLGTLHQMLWPEKLLKGNIWISFMKPDKIISVETVLHALSVLGNSSTITAVSKFACVTKEPDLQLKANACILSIRQRLAEKPDELLRAASQSTMELLKASSQSSTDLLRPNYNGLEYSKSNEFEVKNTLPQTVNRSSTPDEDTQNLKNI